jgi:ferric-dicitrate binding protein FerR (iron transport regulator)
VSKLADNSLKNAGRRVATFAASMLAAVVCLSPAQAQSGIAAKLVQMSGQVSVMKGNAAWALNVGDLIQPQQLIVTGPDGSATFQVSDGSTFEVFPNSKAIFRETMGDWRDLIRMVIGRVRVEIQHLGGQPNPNKVRTPTAVVSVRGTIFDVTVEDDEGTTLVLVEEGRVQVQHVLQPGAPKFLERGEWVEVFWNQPLAARKIDHGPVYQQILHAAKDAAYEILMHSRGATGAASGTGGSSTAADKNGTGNTSDGSSKGGTGGGAPPPPPPAPPPPPH